MCWEDEEGEERVITLKNQEKNVQNVNKVLLLNVLTFWDFLLFCLLFYCFVSFSKLSCLFVCVLCGQSWMPCRQADCLRGYRKWGDGGKGMGAARRRVGVYRVQPSTDPEPNTETTLSPPSPCRPHPSPSSRVFVFSSRRFAPNPSPHLPWMPLSLFAPLTRPSPFYKGFITNKTANLSLVCERGNALDSSPTADTFYYFTRIWSYLPPPPPVWEMKGEVKLGRGAGKENQPGTFFFFCTPSHTCDVSHKQCSAAGVLQHVTPTPTCGSNVSDRKAKRTPMTSHSEKPINDKSDTAQAAANTQDLWHFFQSAVIILLTILSI